MNRVELAAPPVNDTIRLLVKAARRAGMDVESDARRDLVVEVEGPRPIESRHLQAMVDAFLAILAAVITGEHTSAGEGGPILLAILVLTCALLVAVYRGAGSRRS